MTHQPLENEVSSIVQPSYDSLLNDACLIIEEARHVAYRAINNTLTIRNWHLGERIAREELGGAARAEYGERVMEQLAVDLTARYGKGFDKSSLHAYLKFSRLFPEIVDAVSPQLLPWSHYRELIRVENNEARVWYEQEATHNMGIIYQYRFITSVLSA